MRAETSAREVITMATIRAPHPTGAWRSDVPVHHRGQHRLADLLRDALTWAGAVLAGALAPDLVLPEAEPAEVRALLIELGLLDAAAAPAQRILALQEFQRSMGLPADGRADGRTVSLLARSAREHRELRELGLLGLPAR
ncbi:hypothetical protein GCM10027294_04100 [Marinactinospora endophytica]